MTLKREDYRAILSTLESKLREADPDAIEVVNRAADLGDMDFEQSADLKSVVLRYLNALMKVLGERSAGGNGRILDLMNRNIHTEHGGPIEALILELSPLERELHQANSFDLAKLPDRGEFLAQLRSLRDDIEKDGIDEGGPR